MAERFRVGKDDDGVYVWDSKVQPKHTDLCALWDILKKEYDVYELCLVKNYVDSVNDPKEREEAIQLYEQWLRETDSDPKKIIRDLTTKWEKDSKTSFSELKKKLADKHRDRVNRTGKAYIGITKTKKTYRSAGCWSCKSPVNNVNNYECNRCGWIICPECAACSPECDN